MGKKLLWEAIRRVSAQGNSACLLIPAKLKKGLLKENRCEGKWLCYRKSDGSILLEVEFKILEKTETEKQTKKVVRTKFKIKQKQKETWTIQGTCPKCNRIGVDLYKKGDRLLCKKCSR